MARIDWATAARGGKVIPFLLIHGLGYVITLPFGDSYLPAGVSLSGLPALWWPGADGMTIVSLCRGWLELGEGIEGFAWTEAARPTEPGQLDVAQLVVRLADPGGAVTALFDAEDSAVGTYLTAEVAAADTTVHVVSTAGFDPGGGVVYLNREAIEYAGTTSTSFTGCVRGRYGSAAQRHPYDVAAGSGLGTAQVTDRPTEIVGRLATLWLGQVVNGQLSKLSLEYVGHVGCGPQLAGDGAGWQLQIDHASKRLGQKPRAGTVTVGGYVHAGNRGARAAYDVEGVDHYGRNLLRDGTTPVADLFATGGSADWRYAIALTEDDPEPDAGGWHHDAQSYVDALNQAVLAEVAPGDALSYRLEGGHLVAEWRFATPQPASLYWAFDYQSAVYYPPDVTTRRSGNPMPPAFVPILPHSRVYLSATDYAVIPAVPPSLGGDDATEAYWALVWDATTEGGGTGRRAARILANSSSGGVYFVEVAPIVGGVRLPFGRFGGEAFRRAEGILLLEPTVCRVCLFVQSDSWVDALERAVTVFSEDLGDGAAQTFDWDRMRAVARQYGGPFATRREYLIDADTSVLDLVANECALQGFFLTPWQGSLAIARLAEYAATETRAGAITTGSLVEDSPPPGYSRGEDGIVNTFTLLIPESNTTLNFVDRTSRGRYGPSRTSITATLPGGMLPRTVDAAQLATSLGAMAMTTLGPLRYPYRTVAVDATLLHIGLQVGDLVSVALYNVPNGSGGRGLPGPLGVSVAQVASRSPVLFREGTDGMVSFTLRLSPTNLTGWAPGALVAVGGIDVGGSAVTLDTTTFGAGGCAQGGADGGAVTFAVGDKVRLVALYDPTLALATQHEVTSVVGAVVGLTPAPSAGFAVPAATQGVALVFDDWDEVVTAQAAWGYLANEDLVLVDGAVATRARRYAA
ncbi:MAG: hypothetical protein JWM10_3008 [Myxococcaceae bacterium]|nr:hypothetical protein [Myxococcaceae bacterium]